MADLSLEILLKTLCDKHGAEEMQSVMDKIKGSTGDAATATGSLSNATDNLKDSQEQASTSTEKLHINHRALHAIMNMIGRQTAPELGHALTGALYGPIGAALAVGYAFAGIQKYIKGINEDLDKSGELAAQPLFEGVKNLETEWKNATDKVAAYTAAVATAGQDKDAIDVRIKDEESLTRARLDGIKKIIEALGKEEEANIRAGGGTPEQVAAAAERTRKSIEDIEGRKRETGTSALEEEMKTRSAPGYQQSLDKKAKADAEAAERAKTHADNLKSEKERLAKGVDETGAATGAQAEIERLSNIQESFNSFAAGKFNPSDVLTIDKFAADQSIKGRPSGQAGLTAELQEATANREREKQLAASDKARIPGAQEAADEAAIQAEKSAREGKRNAARVAELPDLIKQSRGENLFENANEIIEKGVSAEDAVQKSGRATADQRAAITKLGELANQSGTNMQAILRILAISHAEHKSQQQDIDTIRQQFEALSRAHKNTASAVP